MKFAKRFKAIADPMVMELLKHIEKPEIISFAGGTPAPEALPVQLIKQAMAKIDPNPQYSPTQGLKSLRETLAKIYLVKSENILITSGSQQALDLIGRVFIDPGNKVYVTNPTYFVALYAFNAYTPKYINSIQSAKLSYLVPNFANPTGETLDEKSRIEILKSAKLIVEDDPYGQLYFQSKPPRSIYSFAPDKTIYLTSLSKVVGPSLRLGITIAKPEIIVALTRAKTGMDLCTGALTQQIADYVLNHPSYPKFLESARQYYNTKCQTMIAALDKYMPKGVKWTRPMGGMFIWVTLPKNIDTKKLYFEALKHYLAFVPGYVFHIGNEKSSCLRLSYALPSNDQINRGIKTLANLL
jgi:2-aminoadipate transaminase